MADAFEREADALEDHQLDALLEHLRDARGFDFTGYKRASLGRRVKKRMEEVGTTSYAEYQALLEAQPAEFVDLFNTILINVTAFLRDPDAWGYVRDEIVPKLLHNKGETEPIRVWSAGCASGQEAYSLAIILCDALGEETFRTRVKIYGTDADEDALAQARLGRYPARDVTEALNADQVERYFEPEGSQLVFRADLRRSLIFGRHDLVQDPPISRVDLIVCRNTLMYLNAETQRHVLTNFHFALADGGFLFLGKSEALVSRTTLFMPVDTRRHVFVKRSGAGAARPTMSAAPSVGRGGRGADLGELAFESAPVAQLVVDRAGDLVRANRHARALFGLGINQVGRAFKDLELSYRPVELRSRIEEVFAERRTITITDVPLTLPGGGNDFLDVTLLPVVSEQDVAAVVLIFQEIGRYKLLREELERSQRDLETAYEELQSVNEELETTNEELQSTNEELETTNEELHSTNEELETMNEELQSTNEELETTNNELRLRTLDVDELNSFLESILAAIGAGVIVLNRQLAVRVWNSVSEDLWGLRADEVTGQHLLNLDIGLPVGDLSEILRTAAADESGEPVEVQVEAVNRRGKAIRCDVRVAPLDGRGPAPDGVLVLVHEIGGAS